MVNAGIILIIFFADKIGEALYSQQKQDWELTVAQIMNSLLPNRLKLKKVQKTMRPFRYDLNHIPNDYMEKAMATHSSTLAWKIPLTEKPGRLQSMGSLRVGHD